MQKEHSKRSDKQFFDDGALGQRDGEPHTRGDVGRAHHFGAGLGCRRDRAFIEDVGVDVAGEDRAGAEAVGAFFSVEGLGEAGEAKFRGDVGDAGLRAGFETRFGVDEDEGAGAARPHGREQRLYTIDGAVEIGRHELVIRGEWQLGPAAARGVGAGGVDEGIDVAEAREDGGRHFSHGGVVADVAREGDEAFTSGGGRESDRLGEGIRAATDERDAPTFGGKLVDDGTADAAASARDEGDGGWGGESFLLHDERERGEARKWRPTAYMNVVAPLARINAASWSCRANRNFSLDAPSFLT